MIDYNYMEILKQTRLLKNLTDSELAVIHPFLQEISLPPGSKFIKQSSPISGAYFVISGEILLYSKHPGEMFISLHRPIANDCIGLCGLDRGCLSFYTAMTKSPCTLLKLPLGLIELLAESHPALCHKIHRALTKEFLLHQHANIQEIHHVLESDIINDIPEALCQSSLQIPFQKKKTSLFPLSFSRDIKASKVSRSILRASVPPCFSRNERRKLETYADIIEIMPNVTLFEENQLKNCWFLILEGCVEIHLNFDDKISKLSLLGPKSIFGEISEYELHHRREVYRTREPTVLMKFTSDQLQALAEEQPTIYYKLYGLMTHQVMTIVSQTRMIFEPFLHYQRHPEKEVL